MHIPDGMLSGPVVASAGAGAAGFIGYSVGWIRRHLDQRRVVLMAVMAALVFALQMLNFPVAGGTSGHFAGGAAAAILIGPWPAVVVMTTVLLIQAVLFADGGILALGANVLNLGVIAPFVGYAVWRIVTRIAGGRTGRLIGAFVASWASVFAASLVVALELWLSGRAPLILASTAMGGWHALIGIGEGIITAGLIGYVLAVRPDLVEGGGTAARGTRGVAVGLGLIALAGAGLSFLASSNPDGLEFVYFEQGVGAPFAERSLLDSPIADYVMPGLSNETLAGVLAGVVGVIVTGALLWAAVSTLRARRNGTPHA